MFTQDEITEFLDTLKTRIVYPYKLAWFVNSAGTLNFCFVHEGIFNGQKNLIVNNGNVWFKVFRSRSDNQIRFRKSVKGTRDWQFFRTKRLERRENSSYSCWKYNWKSFHDMHTAAEKMAQFVNQHGVCPICWSNSNTYYTPYHEKNFIDLGGNNIKFF